MNLIFVCAGFGSPLLVSIVGHAFMLVDIGVADLFIHYDNLAMMYLFNLPCSMLMLDIDYFKQVNDKFGHEAGDVVLAHLAKVMKEAVRVTDYVIRWGGEEFLIILPGCGAEQALIIAEKLRKKVEESDNGICPVTISIGVAQHLGGDYHATIKKADEALYAAKRAGRNKAVLFEEK